MSGCRHVLSGTGKASHIHKIAVVSLRSSKIDEDDARRVADWREVAREGEAAGLLINVERGDVVAALVAAGEELAAGIEGEAAGIIAAGCSFADEGEVAVLSYGEDGNCVVHSVARVDESAVGRDENL